MDERASLLPVDSVDVTILVDNAIDALVPSTPLAQRPPIYWDSFEREPLRAEHGYSLLVTVRRGEWRETLLYDAGIGRDIALHNLDVLGRMLRDIRGIVLSHGHADHHGGLEGIARAVER